MNKLTAKAYVEANLPKLKEQTAKLEKSADRMKRFNFRIVLGALIAGPICSGLFALFEEEAKTQDWVLDYQRWVTGGICLIGILIYFCVVFVPWRCHRMPDA